LDGTAEFITNKLALGSRTIQARYSGDSNFKAEGPATVQQTVEQDATTIMLAPSANPSPPSRALTLTAHLIAALPDSGVPTGSVTIYWRFSAAAEKEAAAGAGERSEGETTTPLRI
jgi:trimeric autotransporter adhesin